ncbi:uncharacterized protein BX664DRAFT_343413 [Halteromyces radiatus]|uniref:uncharacterized protein n=1 Tax=Halteromyces radiatus TaxID=101107 RepID=UPI002220413D|nr:uncharacterized protein BX664DRAFT_343413 [Halteromyces radiatus]KAI8077758.1 hypothetical protein BX664DRAFT_343413 [Halteromyces radiatus]
MLQVKLRVGTDLSDLQVVLPYEPINIDSPYFKGYLDIRIKGWNAAQYFENTGNTFCIHIHGKFLTDDTTTDDILFGNQFDSPLQLPIGFSILTRFAQWWDPGLDLHLDEQQPYAFSTLIVTLNKLNINQDITICDPAAEYDVEENTSLITPQKEIISAKERQSYFNHPIHRQQVQVTRDQIWLGDFCNGYLDMMNGSIQIPGFSIDALKYYNGQPLRFICKKRDNSVIYFIIEFDISK